MHINEKPNNIYHKWSISPNLNKAYTHQRIEFTCSQRGEKVIPAQCEIALCISQLELSIKEQQNNKKSYVKNSTLIIL